MSTITASTASTGSRDLARSLPAVAAALFGMFIVWGAGFAEPSVLHNAAHDTRHSFAFPCH